MTQKNPLVNFFDSDFDSENESNIFDDGRDLNVAFIASPGKSISCILDDSSLSDPAGMLIYNEEKEDIEKVKDQKVDKLARKRGRDELSYQGNHLKTTEESFKNGSALGNDFEPYSMTNPGYLCMNEKKWVSTAKRNRMPRFGDLDLEMENIQISEISETTDLSKEKEERTECIFTSTCLGEFKETSEEYDWRKIEKRSFLAMDDESEKIEPKIRVPVSRSDYVYHELSTIAEVDSVLMDESIESLMNSDKCDSLFKHDLRNSKFLKANNSFDIFMKANAPSNFPAYVMKLIQNEHIEKFLQEPGILEESDLTLITTDLDSLSKISERSTKKGYCRNYCNIKRFDDEESPSLISFEQHELSCMRDCTDE
ncbi:unnamed protein product [Larinioides sclopetarius]|uniref:Uncharacterized protein n=1 Tax=Larinioides sclopetarius TaxID=280406 RepID=A0AAV2B0Z6_9ARAC